MFAAQHLKAKNAFVICDTWIDYSLQTCAGFKEAAASYGLKVVGSANMNTSKNTNIATQVTKLKAASGADVVYLAATPPGSIAALKQIRGAGVNLPVISPTATYGLFWRKSLPHLNDYYIDGPAQVYGNKPGEMSGGDPRPEVNALVKRYVDKFGKNPDHGNFLEGYASMQILAQAMKATKSTDGKTLSNWIDHHGPFDTVLGPKVFTPTLHSTPNRQFVFVEYKDTWPTYVATLTPKTKVNLHLGD
jgi:branched-chain amino acid transport system substrate-binding protein